MRLVQGSECWDDRSFGQCAFCKRKADSKEDYWPSWFQKRFPYTKEENSTPYFSTFAHELFSGNKECSDDVKSFISRKKRSGAAMRQTVRSMCQVCNGGWGSKIQERAKSLILCAEYGNIEDLSESELHQLAAWSVMFTMNAEFKNKRNVTIDQKTRELFAANGDVPSGFNVYIGKYCGGAFLHCDQQIMISRTFDCGEDKITSLFRQQVTSFTFSKCWIQVHYKFLHEDYCESDNMINEFVPVWQHIAHIEGGSQKTSRIKEQKSRMVGDIPIQAAALSIINPEIRYQYEKMHGSLSITMELDTGRHFFEIV